MRVINDIARIKPIISALKNHNASIGFVPTMGALHQGHLSLMKRSFQENDYNIVSIFLNPLQFGKNEDLDKYPRPIEKDMKLCSEYNINLLFSPNTSDIYNGPNDTFIISENLSNQLCGLKRPGHFKGVLTIVAKLFNLIMPDNAYFGEKDYQQAILIKNMVKDLNIPVNIILCPTIRHSDGLAMSSRNEYLDDEDKKRASNLFGAFLKAEKLIKEKKIKKYDHLIEAVCYHLKSNIPDIIIDYIEVLYDGTLEKASVFNRDLRILSAVWIKKTRLIDNYRISI